jgi:hypothetical protein
MSNERKVKMVSTQELQKFGSAGYLYRGVSIDKRLGNRGGKSYEVNVTKLATDKYRASFYNTVVTYKFISNTIAEALVTIDNMFDNGDLA